MSKNDETFLEEAEILAEETVAELTEILDLTEQATGVEDIPVGLESKLKAIALNAVVNLARLEIPSSNEIRNETLKIKLQAANLLLNYTMAQEAKALEQEKIAALASSGFPTGPAMHNSPGIYPFGVPDGPE